MIVVRGPLMSITARGWLGGDTYGKKQYRNGVWVYPKRLCRCPYPIALLGKIRVPYSLWDRNIHGFYRMSAWALRPYPGFISHYYSPRGWSYQRRRTWHGSVWSVGMPTGGVNPRYPNQQAWRSVFADAVEAWQVLTIDQKKIYNAYKYPWAPSGYNKYITWYLKEKIKEFKEWSDPTASWSDWQVRWGA